MHTPSPSSLQMHTNAHTDYFSRIMSLSSSPSSLQMHTNSHNYSLFYKNQVIIVIAIILAKAFKCTNRLFFKNQVIAFVRKHYIPEGGSKYQYCEIPYPSEITPFMYMYIRGILKLGSRILESRILESKISGSKLYDL